MRVPDLTTRVEGVGMRNHCGPQSVCVRVRGGASLLVVCFTAGLLALAPSARAAQISDDFNDGNDTANPAWTRYSPLGGSYSFPGGNTYRLQAPVSPNPAFGPGRVAAYLNNSGFSTFSVSIDLVDWNNSLNQAVGPLARLNNVGAGTTTGYALTYTPTQHTLDITRITNESPTGGGLGSVPLILDPAKDYRLVFTGVGSSFTGTVYDLADLSTPFQSVTGTDPNNTYTLGFPGLLVFDNSNGAGTGDATFDNFVVSDTLAPEPAGAAVCGLITLAGIMQRRRRAKHAARVSPPRLPVLPRAA
jgi:hypothetical protein